MNFYQNATFQKSQCNVSFSTHTKIFSCFPCVCFSDILVIQLFNFYVLVNSQISDCLDFSCYSVVVREQTSWKKNHFSNVEVYSQGCGQLCRTSLWSVKRKCLFFTFGRLVLYIPMRSSQVSSVCQVIYFLLKYQPTGSAH